MTNKKDRDKEIEELRVEIQQIKEVLNMILGLISDDDVEDEEPIPQFQKINDFDFQMLN